MADKKAPIEKNSAVKKPKKKFTHSVKKFFRESKSEFKKIVWPTRKQVINNTGVVLVMLIVSSVCISGFDFLLSRLLSLVLGE